MKNTTGSKSNNIDAIKILLAVAVVLIALAVRMPSLFLIGIEKEYEGVFEDESGLPYFTDPDSYYHIRLVDTMMKTGTIADSISSDGEPWDTHSFYPEGRSAVYQPGIVYLTIALWKVFNLSVPLDISRVEFYLSGFLATLTALAAFFTGCRINGKVSGFVAGLLTGCAPEFVYRTVFGRFDTDIFVVLMNILLILFLTEMLRASEFKQQILYAAVFVITSIVYAYCWAPQFSTLFVVLTVVGGLIYSVISNLKSNKPFLTADRQCLLLIAAGLPVLLIIGISMGFSTVADVFREMSFNTTQDAYYNVLPNMFESIAELESPAFVPDKFTDWFRAYNLNHAQTVITGIGGAFVAIAAVGGLVILFLRSLNKTGIDRRAFLTERVSLLYLVVLGVWIVAGLYLTRQGIRFIEILAAPVCLLAGVFSGWLTGGIKYDNHKLRIIGAVISVVFVGAVIIPDFEGVFLGVRLPSVTDASAESMKWIRTKSDDPNAVIVSWWDPGYYYESESGHPCIWDGGTQDPVRAILLSRALTEKDMKMSNLILNMIASSGNKAVDMLMKHTDYKTAFDTIWEVLPMDSQTSCDTIAEKCGMNIQDAHTVEELIHPVKPEKAYLVLTYTMIRQTVMYEYYSDWDFTGTQISPLSYEYSQNEEQLTEAEQEKLEKKRDGYVMWRLFFGVEESPYFTLDFENTDGVEGVRVWKITPGLYK